MCQGCCSSRRELTDRGPLAHRPRHGALGSVTPVFGKTVHDSNELGPIFTPELGPLSKIGGLSTRVWELAKELVSPSRGRRHHLTVLQRRPDGSDKPPEGVRHRARPLDRRIRPGQVRDWSPLCRCLWIWFLPCHSISNRPNLLHHQLLIVFAKVSLEFLCQKCISCLC